MDHSHHDHGLERTVSGFHDHGGSTEDCSSMHAMVFHIGTCQEILFPGWMTHTGLEMFGSCVAIFFGAILYEALRSWREVLFTRGMGQTQAQSQVNITKQECGPDSNCSNQKVVRYPMLSSMHGLQTFLHMVQVIMSYLLMLVFMTYNVWLCIALILGTGVGYFLFAWKKQSVVELTEHCH